ncbi:MULTISPECIES: CAP domain-containing protein [unclassified Modestobacter]|uniref:CAP domain-containing protein n=1 Tax=unclassified Modestobacter TaxID=2643866 RepID=UPI0022AA43B1|nr:MULTISPECIES: CAP domain-containing protein [unclassified Modestobacter]MCZ2826784.1 CAP domain-containing protein [Modestobacter sp. VKM Ac-2981]MCZ2855164.1 CAP domain-containing protein [Modestobacter sp. VKM Ac-2982]
MTRIRGALVAVVLTVLFGTTGCVVSSSSSGSDSPVASSPAPQSAPAGDPEAPAEEQVARAIFDRVNAERETRGLEPVAWNDALATVARDWSTEMADTGEFQHQDVQAVLQEDELVGFRGVGENIFQSTGPVPAGTIHSGWMRSDGHRANVLNPGWDRLGVGVVCAPDGSVWATQIFGRTAGSDQPAVASTTPPAEPIARPDDDGPTC